MKIHGEQIVEVNIDPKDIINNLIEKIVGYRGWTIIKDNKYYKVHEDHKMDIEEEITKEDYDTYKALKKVLKYLEKNE